MNPIIQNMYVSWKTSLMGLLHCILINGVVIDNYVTTHDWTKGHTALAALGLFMLIQGLLARDGDKTSQETGAAQAYAKKLARMQAVPMLDPQLKDK